MDPLTWLLILFLVVMLLSALAQLLWVRQQRRFQGQVLADLAELRRLAGATPPATVGERR